MDDPAGAVAVAAIALALVAIPVLAALAADRGYTATVLRMAYVLLGATGAFALSQLLDEGWSVGLLGWVPLLIAIVAALVGLERVDGRPWT